MSHTGTDSFHWTTSWTVEKWNLDKIQWAQSEAGLWTRVRALRPSQRGYLTRFVGGEAGSVLMRRLGLAPDEVVEVPGNLALNEGITEMWKLVAGITATAYSNANARIGVGTSTTAEAATQTGVITAAVYKAMNASYPSVSAQTITFQSDFGTADANQAWAEWEVDNGATAAKSANRKVQAFGTKPSTQTWTISANLTLS